MWPTGCKNYAKDMKVSAAMQAPAKQAAAAHSMGAMPQQTKAALAWGNNSYSHTSSDSNNRNNKKTFVITITSFNSGNSKYRLLLAVQQQVLVQAVGHLGCIQSC